jgi:cytochrome P450
LLSGLIAAEERDDRLSVAEVVSMCILLLNAGHETTTNLIGNGVLALLQHPEQFERLRNQPERAEDAVEELLRFDAPVQMTGRVARADLMIGPAMIRRGEGVTMVLGSANRDPEVFSEPEQLDLGRNEGRILSFGHGIHVCLGAPLARLEAQIALPMLLEHFPNLNLVAAPERLQSAIFRGLTELYVAG